MAGLQLPVSILAEYRGLDSRSGSFTDPESGEVISYSDALRFEFEAPDGTVKSLAIRTSKLDQVTDLDVAKLARGEFVQIEGLAAAGDRGLYLIPACVRERRRARRRSRPLRRVPRGSRTGRASSLSHRGGVLLAWLAGAVLAGCVYFGLSVVAEAQAPALPCPDAPVEYTGTDEVVNELRALRVDQRATCLATLERLDAVYGRQAAQLDRADTGNGLLEELVTFADPATNPPVEVDTQAVVDAVDASQLEIDAALWFVAGLLVSLFAGSLFAREVLGHA